MSIFFATSFINEFGQVIEPGNEVLFMSTCSHYSSMEKGIFAGVYTEDGKVVGLKITDAPHYWKKDVTRTVYLRLCRAYKFVQ